jgi:lipoyl(octanoyl) transferase
MQANRPSSPVAPDPAHNSADCAAERAAESAAEHGPLVRALGRADYDSVFAAMRAFTDARTPDTRDELWIVEHPPVFTLGLGADRGHLLAGPGVPAHDIPVVQTDRGGEVTYHGPGQVVIYLLMDLRRNKPGGKLYARQFVHKIEQAVIDVLAAYNLAGERVEGAPGIYIADGPRRGAKIAALGLKVRGNGCTYHGVSLNVGMDLAPFGWINPCGYAGLATVDMRTMGVDAPLPAVQQALAAALIHHLATEAQAPPPNNAADAKPADDPTH